MLRITKVADYGIILLTQMVAEPERLFTATELAAEARVPLPMTAKILKRLARAGILESQRGAKGGYTMAADPRRITVAALMNALEGPIALTECIAAGPGECTKESGCPTRANWHLINAAVLGALSNISLAEMCRPLPKDFTASHGARSPQPISLLN